MGIRIHKAIGWGLTDAQMLEHNAFGCTNPDDMHEQLDEVLSQTKELILPSAHVDNIIPGWRGFFTETNLLSKVSTNINRVQHGFTPVDNERDASVLYRSVYTFSAPEGVKYHLFWPNAMYAKSMSRYNDTLDYQEATRDSQGQLMDDPCADLIYAMPENPYPWENFWVMRDTLEQYVNAAGRDWTGLKTTDNANLMPMVPPEIRWYLTELKIIKPDAWVHIRPYYAKWWS